MKWNQYGRIILALVASLALGLSITACNPSFTLGFVYALNTQGTVGTISAYTIDSVSGAITAVANSPFPSGGQYPIAAAVSNNSKWLYVVHEIDNALVQFNIGTDGKLYRNSTVQTPGTYPIAMTIDPSSKFLFVVDSYAPGFNGVAPPNLNPLNPNTVPTQGCVVVYPINQSDGTLQTPVGGAGTCYPLGTPTIGSQPIGITATPFVNYLYVADQAHMVYGFSVDYSGTQTGQAGALVPLTPNSINVGTKPSAIASDATGRFVYVTDQYQNQIYGFTIQAGGLLQSQLNGPFPTGVYPYSLVVDPRGKFLYVTNYNDNNVRAYTINAATGNPSAIANTSGYQTGTGPTCIAIEPAYGRFVYTANYIDNSVTGFKLDPNTGALTLVLNNTFPANGHPTCIATAANGTHPVQSITP